MTKKDYVLIATVLKGCGKHGEAMNAMAMLMEVSYQLATFLKQNNPKFDRKKFLQMAGWE